MRLTAGGSEQTMGRRTQPRTRADRRDIDGNEVAVILHVQCGKVQRPEGPPEHTAAYRLSRIIDVESPLMDSRSSAAAPTRLVQAVRALSRCSPTRTS